MRLFSPTEALFRRPQLRWVTALGSSFDNRCRSEMEPGGPRTLDQTGHCIRDAGRRTGPGSRRLRGEPWPTRAASASRCFCGPEDLDATSRARRNFRCRTRQHREKWSCPPIRGRGRAGAAHGVQLRHPDQQCRRSPQQRQEPGALRQDQWRVHHDDIVLTAVLRQVEEPRCSE